MYSTPLSPAGSGPKVGDLGASYFVCAIVMSSAWSKHLFQFVRVHQKPVNPQYLLEQSGTLIYPCLDLDTPRPRRAQGPFYISMPPVRIIFTQRLATKSCSSLLQNLSCL